MQKSANDEIAGSCSATAFERGAILTQQLSIVPSNTQSSTEEFRPPAVRFDPAMELEAALDADPAIRLALVDILGAAPGRGSILIEGENDTRRDVLLRAIKALSPEPVGLVQMRSIPQNSLDSTLFGHEKDAFIGAFTKQDGAILQCDGGTLVLDEVNCLPPQLQQRLAEAIASKSVRPNGALHRVRVDVRILSTSSEPLATMVKNGNFSGDLFQVLSSTRISLRSPKAAKDEHRRRGTESRQLSVMLYTESGELRRLDEIEDDVIRLAMSNCPGPTSVLASQLGIGRSTLYRKLTKLGVD